MPEMNTKERILMEAEKIAVETGALHITLEAVAERAGLSKGGLLYHFPNKEILLKSMLNRFLENEMQVREDLLKNIPPGPDAKLKAHILAWNQENKHKQRFISSILAVTAHNPEYAEPFREKLREFSDELMEESANSDPYLKLLLMLAVNGLWLFEVLGIAPFSAEQRVKLFEKTMEILEDGGRHQ